LGEIGDHRKGKLIYHIERGEKGEGQCAPRKRAKTLMIGKREKIDVVYFFFEERKEKGKRGVEVSSAARRKGSGIFVVPSITEKKSAPPSPLARKKRREKERWRNLGACLLERSECKMRSMVSVPRKLDQEEGGNIFSFSGRKKKEALIPDAEKGGCMPTVKKKGVRAAFLLRSKSGGKGTEY